MKNLVLVGFMGTGKTVVGQRAAARLGMTFVDTDQLIEQRTGQKISDIFAKQGEACFRKIERELVRELASQPDRVIATGGGVVLDANNLRDLGRTGIIICLWSEPDVIYERTRKVRDRPLLEDQDRRQRIEQLLHQRAPLYKAIPLHIDNTHTTVDQDVDEVIRIYRDQTAGVRP